MDAELEKFSDIVEAEAKLYDQYREIGGPEMDLRKLPKDAWYVYGYFIGQIDGHFMDMQPTNPKYMDSYKLGYDDGCGDRDSGS